MWIFQYKCGDTHLSLNDNCGCFHRYNHTHACPDGIHRMRYRYQVNIEHSNHPSSCLLFLPYKNQTVPPCPFLTLLQSSVSSHFPNFFLSLSPFFLPFFSYFPSHFHYLSRYSPSKRNILFTCSSLNGKPKTASISQRWSESLSLAQCIYNSHSMCLWSHPGLHSLKLRVMAMFTTREGHAERKGLPLGNMFVFFDFIFYV